MSATGLGLGNRFLRALARAVPAVQTFVDVTIFAPLVGLPGSPVHWDDYFVAGKVAYSTLLTDGTVLKARSGKKLIINVKSGGGVFVNGVRLVSLNTLTSNGVVHFLER